MLMKLQPCYMSGAISIALTRKNAASAARQWRMLIFEFVSMLIEPLECASDVHRLVRGRAEYRPSSGDPKGGDRHQGESQNQRTAFDPENNPAREKSRKIAQ
jgi:hypothetical protein